MKYSYYFAFLILMISAALVLPSLADAAPAYGVLRVVKGDVKIKSGKNGQVKKARLGQKVYPRDSILTAVDSRAKIVMVDNNEINVSPKSQVMIENYEFEPAKNKKNVLLNVIYGKVRNKVKQKYDGTSNKFNVKTPSAVAGVRGTDFFTSYNAQNNATNVVTFEGEVAFGLPDANGGIAKPVMVRVGQMASAANNTPPAAPVLVPKSELASLELNSDAERGVEDPGESRMPASEPVAPSDDDASARDDGANNSDQPDEGPAAETADSTAPVEEDRAPAATEDTMLVAEDDLATNAEPIPIGSTDGADLPPLPADTLPPLPPEYGCGDFCERVIESGSAKLILTIQNQ